MKKKIIKLLTCLLIVVFLVGCSSTASKAKKMVVGRFMNVSYPLGTELARIYEFDGKSAVHYLSYVNGSLSSNKTGSYKVTSNKVEVTIEGEKTSFDYEIVSDEVIVLSLTGSEGDVFPFVKLEN